MYFQEFFAEVLREPFTAIAYHASRHLAASYPDRAMIEGCDCDFNKLLDFARAGRAGSAATSRPTTRSPSGGPTSRGSSSTPGTPGSRSTGRATRSTWSSWTGATAASPTTGSWPTRSTSPGGSTRRSAGTSPSSATSSWSSTAARWTESGRLFRQIGGATFENLILPEKLKGEIRADVERFFASRAAYEKHGVPWKRGLLLVGPPGNGKTHAIKALINETGRPCLYVKTFDSEHFDRARPASAGSSTGPGQCSPCLLVLEDLDSLITDENRSFFLNELDGFAANAGILTIATTNHPGRLDPAILDRPSRFDRKYHFGLPGPDRAPGLHRAVERLAGARGPAHPRGRGRGRRADRRVLVRLPEGAVPLLADGLGRRARAEAMDAILLEQVGSLREQMQSTAE